MPGQTFDVRPKNDENLRGSNPEKVQPRNSPRLLSEHHHVGVDQSESIDDDFSFDALNGVDDDGDGSVRQGLEGLLRVDVDAREPTAEARVGVVPADDHLRSARLLEHVQHFGLKKIVTVQLPTVDYLKKMHYWGD